MFWMTVTMLKLLITALNCVLICPKVVIRLLMMPLGPTMLCRPLIAPCSPTKEIWVVFWILAVLVGSPPFYATSTLLAVVICVEIVGWLARVVSLF